MTKQEIYEQVVHLTSELHTVGVAEKIFSAAKTGDASNVESVFETFKKENTELYERIESFGHKFNKFIEGNESRRDGEIFGEEECVTAFDANVVDAPSLYTLTFFANIMEIYIIDWTTRSSDAFVEAIREAGYEKMAVFIETESWQHHIGKKDKEYDNLYELLIAIFNGELEEEFQE